jgi:phosphoribosylanthranilate isomerase
MMERIKLKVCGMKEDDNIRAVGDIRPDYMGFIFYPQSPRFIGGDFQFVFPLSPQIKKVGVFVNELSEEMLWQLKRLSLDYLQLHGDESVAQCEELKKNGAKLIKAFSIDEDFDFSVTRPYQPSIDYFLFDTKGKYYGGNARTFDWNILNKYDQKVPFFLSGGISPYNAADVLKLEGMNIHALDVNSGVEINPGLKDIIKVNTIKKILNHEQ